MGAYRSQGENAGIWTESVEYQVFRPVKIAG